MNENEMNTPKSVLVRAASFSSAHKYHSANLSLAENKAIYGSYWREHGFGHNFRVEAHIEGSVEPLTGMIVNLVDVDQWLKEVTGALDHRFLNDLPQFQGQPMTPETIASWLFIELAKRVALHPRAPRLRKLRLYEGERSWVDVYPD